jgi:saccharopine dehydrogenase (NAD+, L-lysine-forming)
MSKRVLIIGAGGVGRVVTHKCAQVPEVFGPICLASRRREKCETIASELSVPIETAEVDADQTPELVRLIQKFKPDILINVALPYQDLTIMDACLETGVPYVDTANYEPRDVAKFEYHWQWAYRDRFREKGITALLGSGFDPGVTNVFCAYASKHLFDRIDTIDILDCNAGDHGHPFATNFNPEINIREITSKGRYWEQGEWRETPPLDKTWDFDYPGIGVKRSYLMYHEEIESLCQNIPDVKRIRFWMTFGKQYLTHLKVLQNVGLTRIDPVDFDGQSIVPLQFLKAILPDPGSLGPRTKGQTCIGCLIDGEKDGKHKRVFIHNNCDHESCYREVKAQAISYTTGVPAMIGAKMILEGRWRQAGVFNIEEFDPDPFMADLNQFGLPWKVEELGHESLPV